MEKSFWEKDKGASSADWMVWTHGDFTLRRHRNACATWWAVQNDQLGLTTEFHARTIEAGICIGKEAAIHLAVISTAPGFCVSKAGRKVKKVRS